MATRRKTGKVEAVKSRTLKKVEGSGMSQAKTVQWAIVNLSMVKEDLQGFYGSVLKEQNESAELVNNPSSDSAWVSFEDFSNELMAERDRKNISEIRKQIFNDVFLHVFALTGIERKFMDNIITGYFKSNIRSIAPLLCISKKTYYNQEPNRKFSTEVSERFLSLLRLYVKGEDVFGEVEDFNNWLELPNPQFKNVPPSEMLKTGFGIEAVMNELGRIEFGILA